MTKRLLIVFLLLSPLMLAAQTSLIRGTVLDTTKALIPGATVEMENLATGQKQTTLSDDRGSFSFTNVTLGKVRVTVTLTGFQKWTQVVQVGMQPIELSATLQISSAATTVEVTASAPSTVSQSSASVGQVVITTRSGTGGGEQNRARVRGPRPMNTESYDYIADNPFIAVKQQPRSTFAVDVDTASYANMRRFLNEGMLPPKDAVRIEEMVNYFKYAYPPPDGPAPVAIHTEVAPAFWNPTHRLVRIGIRARDIDISARKSANLVFLIDVSGSMMEEAKLPLVQRSLHLMVDPLREDDKVTMVVYAGNTGLVLPPTSGSEKAAIHNAIDRLKAGGSTNGGAGIELAYRMATENFIRGGINRVILATDGDFNVGVTSPGDLVRLIQQKAESGVSLTVLGFGFGNYKDSTLEKLADKGHGNYAYIDSIHEAKRVLVEQMSGTLMTVAKDVKLQIEFNPVEVQAFRLIGYENRLLRDEEFDDDRKQGGDMGAGHNVTAFFEIVPKDAAFDGQVSKPLKYQKENKPDNTHKGELLTVSLRYKLPEGTNSRLIAAPVPDSKVSFEAASPDFQFAAAVAAFGMVLRDSPHKGSATVGMIIDVASRHTGQDPSRSEFVELGRKAVLLLN
jgi:Ca-activated chloride channel family protein